MEFKHKNARKDYVESVSDQVINHFIAQATQPQSQQPVIDPKMLQPGQKVIDQTGKEMTVMQNNQQDDSTTLVPSDKVQTVPEGVQTIKNTDVQNQYQVKQV